ncbi:DUF4297 domain-containing protein [Yinghuangia sp. ASG 101]|uniref:dsDNA nuclease domain-containing protein n=1 Tax=Yinghuangia sp. ASG 101 TaxID=2896848 RepID=UPI001E418AF8|nr:dsDNA nuclease domain-containing protein [Yinghuangia sp. ASG 101]UGQ14867.1 DUF4297 domain-containing protein [Yinghuangia sp. ASG 101]
MADALDSGSAAGDAALEAEDALGQLLFQLEPEEDSGSQTLGWYRYQAQVAARDCLAMLTEERIDFVVCEWHEDFVVAYTDGSVELVSVKHRQLDLPPWTLVELCKSGGLAHLFDRWCACECAENVRLRLATNAGLNTVPGNARWLAGMCGPDPRIAVGVREMATAVAHQFLRVRWDQPYPNIPVTPKVKKNDDIAVPPGFVEKVRRFLGVLEITSKLPSQGGIKDENIRQLLEPAVDRLGMAHVDVDATYRALIERIEQANRGDDVQIQLAAYIADPERRNYDKQLQLRIARRTLARKSILDTFVCTSGKLPVLPRGALPASGPGGHRLAQKLRRGRVSSDEAVFAEQLRSAWYATWAGLRSGLAGDEADLFSLSLAVLDVVFRCRDQAQERVVGDDFGPVMHRLMAERLTSDGLAVPLPFPVNDLHLRGLAYQLAEECRFFLSEPFELDGEAS